MRLGERRLGGSARAAIGVTFGGNSKRNPAEVGSRKGQWLDSLFVELCALRYHAWPLVVERARSSSKCFASRSAWSARTSEASLIDEFLCCLASSRQRWASARQAAPARARSPLSILYPDSPLFVVFLFGRSQNQSVVPTHMYTSGEPFRSCLYLIAQKEPR